MKTFLLILLSVAIAIGGQFCLKHGVMSTGTGKVELDSATTLMSQVWAYFQNPFIWLGLGLYALGAVAWMMVLSRADVSFAYPMLGLGYVAAVFIGYYYRGEPVTEGRWIGVVLIVLGVACIGNEALIKTWLGGLFGAKS